MVVIWIGIGLGLGIAVTFLAASNLRRGFAFSRIWHIAHFTSGYHHLRITERKIYNGIKSHYRFLEFKEGGYQGGMDLLRPDIAIFSYVRIMMNVIEAYHPNAEQYFMIGHGIGSLTRLIRSQDKHIEVAEIDEAVLEISQMYFGYRGDEVQIGDGYAVLATKADQSIDVIILDAYSGGSVPAHLKSLSFFALTRQKLKENGLIVMNVVGQINHDAEFASYKAAVASAFPSVVVYAKNPRYPKRQNLIIAASSTPMYGRLLQEGIAIM